MAIRELKDQIARLPEQPGVYLYFNAAGETIYVGKARALRDRVRNYLGAYGADPKTDALLEEIVRLEFIVTDSVVEALALENNLIKQRSPKYNILLRDDKNYPYLQLTTNEAFPRVLVARSVERDGSFYAGPFLPAKFARKTMSLTHRLFGIRSCNEVITGKRSRPCLEYDIKRCIAPCVDSVCSPEEYGRAVELTALFLEGRNDQLARTLQARMTEAASGERFEEAAQLRDAMRTVQALQDRQQKMATAELGNRDVFGMKLGPGGAVVYVFQVRSGRVIERIEMGADTVVGGREADVLEAALQQFYEPRTAPPEVHVPVTLDDQEALETWLSERAGRRVRLVVPQRGEKRGLVDLATRNASIAYQTRMNQGATTNYHALETLQGVLGLPVLPRRIECFDISTIQGSETVASMVVCEDGRMKKGEYRKFRIKGLGLRSQGSGPDDFAAMNEVVTRRYRKLLESGGPFPDLVLIDGGKGQLSAAYAALEGLGLSNLVAVGLAKKEELLFVRDRDEPVVLATNDPALLLLQRVRDEAHRFAVTFHRQARSMRDLHSELDHVPGVGPRRRRTLLTRFGSLAAVRRATREELAAAVGPKVADAVLAFFSGADLTCTALPDINIAQILIAFVVLLLSLTVHEAAHAWTADRLGDPTARMLGRVSFNPIVHADLIGTVVFPLVAMVSHVPLIGWAKPVPVTVSRLRRGRTDFMLVAAAGPASNLLIAVAASLALRLAIRTPLDSVSPLGFHLSDVLVRAMALNVMLAVFNMLPIPPLDGGNVLAGLLPRPLAAAFDQLRPYGFILIYALLLTGGFDTIVMPPALWLASWLY